MHNAHAYAQAAPWSVRAHIGSSINAKIGSRALRRAKELTQVHSTPSFVLPHIAQADEGDTTVPWPVVDQRTTLFDVGCGDGAVLRHVVKQCGCRGVGWEINTQRAQATAAALVKEGLGAY